MSLKQALVFQRFLGIEIEARGYGYLYFSERKLALNRF